MNPTGNDRAGAVAIASSAMAPLPRLSRRIRIACGAGTLIAISGSTALTQSAPSIARGVVRAVNQAVISTDLAVPVARTPVRDGQAFKRGDIILELDCRKPIAEHDAALAVTREMKATYDSQNVIVQHGAGGRNELAIARARYDKADAELRAHAARIEQCRVAAPYDGNVVELSVREHEMTTPGKPVISIVADHLLEIELIVDTSALRTLAVGREFSFHVDELATNVATRLDRIAGTADPVSRTIKLIGAPIVRPPNLVPGMSGTASFEN